MNWAAAKTQIHSLKQTQRLIYDAIAVDCAQKFSVTFSDCGNQHRWIETNDSLLEFIESRGIDVEHLYRAGECVSCRTKLIEGEVEYHQKPGINPGRGYCLLCISKPKSNLALKR